jgi:hypothetical protein
MLQTTKSRRKDWGDRETESALTIAPAARNRGPRVAGGDAANDDREAAFHHTVAGVLFSLYGHFSVHFCFMTLCLSTTFAAC